MKSRPGLTSIFDYDKLADKQTHEQLVTVSKGEGRLALMNKFRQ